MWDFNFDEIAISATASITGGAVTIDGPYATFPVAIDINTTDIGQYDGRPDYPGYFTRNTTLNTVTIKFCVKPELGNVLGVTDQNGNPVISSISYTKIKLIIDIDMEQGFDTASITVVEDTPYQGNQSVQIDYDCKWWILTFPYPIHASKEVPKLNLTPCFNAHPPNQHSVSVHLWYIH